MRFGLFVPQGWRLDLAGIDPAEHWQTMLGVASAAEDVPADVAESRIRDYAQGPLVGTPEQIVERLTKLGQLGMTYAITNFAEVAYDRSGLTLFTEKVATAFAPS